MGSASAAQYDVAEKDIATLQADMSAGRVTSEEIVRAYLARIDRLDRNGPRLQSVIAVNPNALANARALDAERKGPLVIKERVRAAGGQLTIDSRPGHGARLEILISPERHG